MALVLRAAYKLYFNLDKDYTDPRTKNLPLVGSTLVVLGIIGLYLAFVQKWGPKWMENKKPYDLKQVIQFYNITQIVINFVIFSAAIYSSFVSNRYSYVCQPIDHTDVSPNTNILLWATYGYYLIKYLDLLDTIFFVLRKRYNQITFLHIYHHAGMIFAVHIFTKYLLGSHSTMLGIINSLVHIFMYGYYFLTSINSDFKHQLNWKKRITQLQLLQFGYLTIHFVLPLILNDCKHPKLITIIGLTQNIFMFALFYDFYYKTYCKNKNNKQ